MLACRNLDVSTQRIARGVWDSLKRFLLGGETIYANTWTAKEGGGWIALEETAPGQIACAEVKEASEGIRIRHSAYLGHSPNVALETQYTGLKGYMSGQGLAQQLARCPVGAGDGKVYFHTTIGQVRTFDLTTASGPILVDNDMILAHSEALGRSVRRINRTWKSLFLSGEGLAVEFCGQGRVWVGSGVEIAGTNPFYKACDAAGEKIGDWMGKAVVGVLAITLIYRSGLGPKAVDLAEKIFT
jgi:uncharacterized protein (AIM24 family)